MLAIEPIAPKTAPTIAAIYPASTKGAAGPVAAAASVAPATAAVIAFAVSAILIAWSVIICIIPKAFDALAASSFSSPYAASKSLIAPKVWLALVAVAFRLSLYAAFASCAVFIRLSWYCLSSSSAFLVKVSRIKYFSSSVSSTFSSSCASCISRSCFCSSNSSSLPLSARPFLYSRIRRALSSSFLICSSVSLLAASVAICSSSLSSCSCFPLISSASAFLASWVRCFSVARRSFSCAISRSPWILRCAILLAVSSSIKDSVKSSASFNISWLAFSPCASACWYAFASALRWLALSWAWRLRSSARRFASSAAAFCAASSSLSKLTSCFCSERTPVK